MSDAPERYADDERRYRLESLIATGGMGEVWRAHDAVLGRAVAVKLLRPEFADDPQFRSRFETEARHAAALHHPGIASVFDFGQARDESEIPRPYLVMELVDGQPLSALLRPGIAMDIEVATDLMAQAADALGAAHAAGIVHRDIKPANLLVTPDRAIKVTDFGIARAADTLPLTEPGQVVGTAHYLSPEQARGELAGPASDVYSLGVVAFECLTGKRPFTAESPVATAIAHVREPVPELPSTVPAPLADVVRRALAKDAAERFPDGAAFAAALRDPAVATEASTRVLAPTSVVPPVAPALTPAPASAPTPVSAPASLSPGEPPDPERRRVPAWLPWLLTALLLVVGLWALVDIAGGGDDTTVRRPDREPTPSGRQSPTPSQPSPASPSAPETSEDTSVTVDPSDYVGRDRIEVESELGGLGLRVTSQAIDNDGRFDEGEVASVNPSGVLNEGDSITVTYYGPPPEEPSPTEPPETTETPQPSEPPTPSLPTESLTPPPQGSENSDTEGSSR